MSSGISNTMNTPIEILEMSFPVRIERYAILPDSGGVGRWRGGCGVERVWRILGKPAQVSICCERVLNTKGTFTAPPGAQIVMHAPGSGGYGPPSERDPARLRDDVLNGYVTAEGVVEAYGSESSGEPACRACASSGSPKPIAR